MEFYQKAFFVVLAALVGYGLLLVLQPFAGALTWAIFLAFILYPVHRWMTRKFHGREGLSAGIHRRHRGRRHHHGFGGWHQLRCRVGKGRVGKLRGRIRG